MNAISKPDTRTALDLEALVTWAIKTQRADKDDVALFGLELAAYGTQRGWEPRGQSADGCARQERIGNVGCQIDGGASIRGVAPRLHPDAEAVMDAINRLKAGRGLVIRYARLGERPEWLNASKQRLVRVEVPDTQRGGLRHKVLGEWVPCPTRGDIARWMQRRGEALVDQFGRSKINAEESGFTYRALDDGSRMVLVRHCPVELRPSNADVEHANAVYRLWHASMMALLGELMGVGLRDYRLTGFTAPVTPWA